MPESPIGQTHDAVVREDIGSNPDFANIYHDARVEGRLALALAELRERRGLTQRALAQMLGTSQPMIARIERGGQSPTVPTLLRFMAALDATAEIGPDDIVIRPVNNDQ